MKGFLPPFLFLVLSLLIVGGSFIKGEPLWGDDSDLWVPLFVKENTKGLMAPQWYPYLFAGLPVQFFFLGHGFLTLLSVPAEWFFTIECLLDLFLCGLGMYLLASSMGLGLFGSLVAGSAFMLSSHLVTWIRAGHVWKLDSMCWMPFLVLFLTRAVRGGQWKDFVLLGFFFGLTLLGGEVQMAYYAFLVLLAYFLCLLIGKVREEGPRFLGRYFLLTTLSALLALALSAQVVAYYLIEKQEVVDVESAPENWLFSTYFSFPPEESLSLAFTNRLFGEPMRIGGYFGRMDQRNTDDYLGIGVMLLALLGLLFYSRGKVRFFWASLAFVCLILSFGRYFPWPYYVLYQLPFMKTLRSPHRWLFFVSFATALLSGYGALAWQRAAQEGMKKKAMSGLLLVFLLLALFLLTLGLGGLGFRAKVALYAQGFLKVRGFYFSMESLEPRVGDVFSAISRGGMFLFVSSGLLLLSLSLGKGKRALIFIQGLLLLALWADLLGNGWRFISTYDPAMFYEEEGKELMNFLKQDAALYRLKLWDAKDLYLRHLAKYQFRYHNFFTFDSISSRVSHRYSAFLSLLKRGQIPLETFFDLFNIKYILSSSRATLPKDMNIKEVAIPSGVHVYRYENFTPRAWLVNKYQKVNGGEAALRALCLPGINLKEEVILEEEPELKGLASAEPVRMEEVNVIAYSPWEVAMDVSLSQEGLLVFSDFYHEGWWAEVNGLKATTLRANYLMRALALPAGDHHVVWHFKPWPWGFSITLISWLFLFSLGLGLLLKARKAFLLRKEIKAEGG